MNKDDIKALELINEARESHRFCCISIYSDYDYCWEIKWVLADSKELRTHCHDELFGAVLEFNKANP